MGSGSTGHNQIWFEGDGSDDFAVNQGNGSQTSPDERFGGNISVPVTYFMVWRHNWDAGSSAWDSTDVWINPAFGAAVPTADHTTSVVDDSTSVLASVFFGGRNGAHAWDDITYGTEWNDVVPIPEPASLALLAMGGLAMLRRR